ncbi:Glycine--tRNA ligase beta subunit, partial [Haemophilus influenzae]
TKNISRFMIKTANYYRTLFLYRTSTQKIQLRLSKGMKKWFVHV